MDAQRFLAEFGLIANAPGGVGTLRELVLYLAVTGRLLPQIATDEHAEKILERIRFSTGSVGTKKRSHQKKRLDWERSAKGRFIPSGWALAELGELGDWGAGSTPSRSNSSYFGGNIPWFKSGELKSDYITKSEEFVSELALKECSLRLNIPGDVLIAMYGANIGQTAIVGVKSTTNQAVCACTPHEGLINRFLLLLLRGLKSHFISLGAGGAQPNISKEKIVAIPIGLPPTAEQSRIVAKVDELMALCDKLEAQQQEKAKLAKLGRSAALDAFVSARDSDELNKSWARVQSSPSLWGYESQAIQEFRNAIGALAYRGMLTESVAIAASKPISESLPDLPTGWEWETLGSLTEYITSGSRGWKAYMASSGDTFIRSQDIKQDAVIFENRAFVALPERTEGKRTLVQPDDLLLTITGGNVGKCARVPALDCKAYVSQHVALIRLKKPEQSEFIHSWMTNTHGGRKFLSRYIYGDKPGLNLSQVASVPVPIPPPEVQKSIVRQLRHYGKLCAQLAEQIEDASRIAETFAAVSVAAITGIRPEEEEEPLKIPKTELIAPLRLGSPPGEAEQAPLAALLAHHGGELSARDLWLRFGGGIDAFYAQLKTEVAQGWIREPEPARVEIGE